MNPEGGSSNFAFATRDSHSELAAAIQPVRGIRRPKTDFFLRAESPFTAATYLEELAKQPAGNLLTAYGGVSLHEQSHGESFLAVMINRLGAEGFYLLDEPEATLSTQNCLTCLRSDRRGAEAGRLSTRSSPTRPNADRRGCSLTLALVRSRCVQREAPPGGLSIDSLR